MRKVVMIILTIGGFLLINLGVCSQIVINQRDVEEVLIERINKLEDKNKQLKRDYKMKEREANYWQDYNSCRRGE